NGERNVRRIQVPQTQRTEDRGQKKHRRSQPLLFVSSVLCPLSSVLWRFRMLPLLACLALAADPADDWQKSEAAHLATANHPTTPTSSSSSRTSSAPAKATSPPTARPSSSRPRRRRAATPSTRSSP